MEATTLREAGYDVSVISPAGRGWTSSYEAIDGVHVYRFPEPPEAHSGFMAYAKEYTHALFHMAKLTRKVWRERGFDVIQGCNPPDLIFLIALFWRVQGVRYLFDHHDVCPELFEAKFGKRGVLWWVMRLFERLTFAAASVSIATNASFRHIALTRGRMTERDVFIVRSAPRVTQFQRVPQVQQEERETAPVRMGYVGVIGQQEGMDILVSAADHLIRDLGRKAVHFDIAGFGSQLSAVKADVIERGLEKYFTFHGPLYGDALLEMLSRCDVGLSPDPKNEMNDISTMNKIMEYMSLGMPVVQFDLTEGRASSGDASLYAEPNCPRDYAAKLLELIDDPDRRARMGRIGRVRMVKELSWERSAEALLAAYDRIFAKLRICPAPRHKVMKAHDGAAQRGSPAMHWACAVSKAGLRDLGPDLFRDALDGRRLLESRPCERDEPQIKHKKSSSTWLSTG
jgi:glycosyltransferase involved in cell wall biosynthesis